MSDEGAGAIHTPDPSAESVLASIASGAAGQIGAENFPVALRLLPRRPRAHLARVYAFARFVDDVGDRAPGDRLALLDRVDAELRGLPAATATLPPVAGLQPVVDECAVPIELFLDLVEANRVDQVTTRYETFDALLGYCALSAAPVGRIVLHIAGAATDQNIADSDAVCAALQVFEHCQDVGEDATAGRIYLPHTELRAAGVTDQELLGAETSAALRAVVATQVDRSAGMLAAGRPLVRRLKGWSRVAVAGYVAGGLATADALRASGYDVLARQVAPRKSRTAVHTVRVMVGGRT
ncbi:MAG: squalene synthase HpnC [Jatrophihabitans sp.]